MSQPDLLLDHLQVAAECLSECSMCEQWEVTAKRAADEIRRLRAELATLKAQATTYWDSLDDLKGGVEQMLTNEQCGGYGWWEGWKAIKLAHAKAHGRHVHHRDCYDDAGAGAGGVSLICNKLEYIDPA